MPELAEPVPLMVMLPVLELIVVRRISTPEVSPGEPEAEPVMLMLPAPVDRVWKSNKTPSTQPPAPTRLVVALLRTEKSPPPVVMEPAR